MVKKVVLADSESDSGADFEQEAPATLSKSAKA
eukprot:CAMPEP_0170471938 /NCGR_PEP_ID=MMETSP0123-20130129/14063_1 /TAXON_ID=182087 /ORGANISM="Favella ehrenbergii, Strain Fehren 1" /LENGTH=32 /DNA_ID= /DNA_START= /DNA_END= /DNA_ORIENTATION=